ncbi:MAG: polysaccharide biosynthesis protein [Methanobacteriales archaeon Met13]
MTTKIAKGSLIMLIGAFVFRIGGYFYRFATAYLLGPVGFGILNLAIPLQGILITLASGGMPPAIAKYVAEYSAQGDDEMVKQVIHTSSKMVLILGLLFSVAIFLLAEPLAVGFFNKPEATQPFQLVALITPFSVMVAVLRGTFQGSYQMGNIVITKAFEQIFMISSAIILILAGFYVAGAVIGTSIGFIASAAAGYVLYRRGVGFNLKDIKLTLSFKQELSIAKMLFIFALPVVITGLAELALFDFVGNFVIGFYLPSQYVGYYGAASPVARLPLIISMAVATAVLPAAAEAIGLNDQNLLKTYVNQSYRYVALLVLPLSVGTMVFAAPIISLVFGRASLPGAQALQILAAGMLFFTIYTVSSSISQGLGKPYLPMTVLVLGTFLDLGLSIYLVPTYGINGAAIATTISAFFIMSTLSWQTLKIAGVSLSKGDFIRIIGAAVIMGLILLILPKNYLFLLVALVLSPVVYLVSLIILGGLKKGDVRAVHKLSTKMGPLYSKVKKLADFLDRFAR